MKKIMAISIILSIVVAVTVYFKKEPEPAVWEEYVVSDGDTLYDISKSITPNSEDYRQTQYYIIERNNLNNVMIYPGQIVLIPHKANK